MSSLQNTSLLHVFSSAISSTHSPHSHRKVLQQLLQLVFITYSHNKKQALLCVVRTSSDRYSSNLAEELTTKILSSPREKSLHSLRVFCDRSPDTGRNWFNKTNCANTSLLRYLSDRSPAGKVEEVAARKKEQGPLCGVCCSTELHHCSASRRAAGVNPSL